MFTFSVFDRKYPFRANLVKKINFVSLTWNFILRLILVCRILFTTGNTAFRQIWSKKIKIVSLGWNLVPSLIRICRFNDDVYFFRFWPEIPFLGKFVHKLEIVFLSWNLVPRLIKHAEFNGDVHLFSFWPKTPFLDKFGPKK